jgi:phage terminase small subunit
MAERKLTDQQKLFIAEYLKDRNGTQAAIRAGYSADTAQEQASRLLSKVMVRAAVDKKVEKLEERSMVTAEYVIRGLKEIAERCMQRNPVMEFDHESKSMVQKTDPDTGLGVWEFDAAGANKSHELLGRYLKLFTDRVEVGFDQSFADRLNAAKARRANAKG